MNDAVVMAEIWREVPFAWRADRPFRLGPPAKHRCAPGARRAR